MAWDCNLGSLIGQWAIFIVLCPEREQKAGFLFTLHSLLNSFCCGSWACSQLEGLAFEDVVTVFADLQQMYLLSQPFPSAQVLLTGA